MMRIARWLVPVLLLSASLGHAAGSGPVGGGGAYSDSATPSRTPEQRASSAYKSGQKYKKRAGRYETKAAEASTEAKRDKYLDKALAQYEKSVDKYLEAFPDGFLAQWISPFRWARIKRESTDLLRS